MVEQQNQPRPKDQYFDSKYILLDCDGRVAAPERLAIIQAIVDERERQISFEGWSTDNDDQYERGELAEAAACYALHANDDPSERRSHYGGPAWWPFPARWWKPKDPRRDLVRAAALIIAEIERIDRKASQQRKGA